MNNKPDSQLLNNVAIKNAFYDLAQDYSFEAITVNQIIKQAQISRDTFYQRFNSITELINKYQHALLNEMQHKMIYKTPKVVNDGHTALLNMLSFIDQHQLEFKVMLYNDHDQHFKEVFNQSVQLLLLRLDPIESDFINHKHSYICEMYEAILIKWINNDCIESIESMHRFINCLHQPIATSNFGNNNTID